MLKITSSSGQQPRWLKHKVYELLMNMRTMMIELQMCQLEEEDDKDEDDEGSI